MFILKSRFLIVDDSHTTRDLIRLALKKMNYKNIDETTNGKKAWIKVLQAVNEGEPYSLIISDIIMPEINGLKLLEMVRTEPKTSKIPVLIITTEVEKQTVIQAVLSGVSGYMVKPFGVDDVKNKIEEIYKRVVDADSGSARP